MRDRAEPLSHSIPIVPDIVYIGNGALGAGRRGLRIVHGMQGDAGSGRVLPPEAFHLFSCRPLVTNRIISFCFSRFRACLLLFFLCPLFPPLLFFHLCRLQPLLHLNGMDFDVPAQLGGMPKLFQPLCEDADLRRARFIAIELLALLYEDSDFILRFLPDGGKLAPVLDVVFEDEFRLFDPLVQLADILPHSIAWVPGLFRQRPHLVEIGKVESPQAGKPAGRRFPKKEQEAAGRRLFFPSPVRRLGIQDAALDGFRGVLSCPRF